MKNTIEELWNGKINTQDTLVQFKQLKNRTFLLTAHAASSMYNPGAKTSCPDIIRTLSFNNYGNIKNQSGSKTHQLRCRVIPRRGTE